MVRVTRKKPAKRGAGKRNSKRKQTKQGFPYIATFVAVLLIAFILYFVFAVEKPPAQPKQKKVVKEEVLPEKPQPKWDYVDILKTKEVKVDIPEKKKPTLPYQMQCGSFRHQKDAESLKAKIAFQGLESQVLKTGNWYRVILGPYERKRLAERQRHKLQRARIDGCQIWFWR
ncbi:cell division protein [Psychromonas sp. RZ22]|uniref:SPOR domain-containing protein n=1 Tax=Psychromonas algarum TaxID=2555643 RepID=UPI001068D06E|nr:SPOR domain-containing protein [Psychromonas sp. RZ22]TEW53165.1 cell division protein [Psychromonas sp. RZ22]